MEEHIKKIIQDVIEETLIEKNDIGNQLLAGIDVEKEHYPTYTKIKKFYLKHNTFPKSKTVYKWIAMDHLKEIPDYYSRLKKMEDNL